MNTTAPPGRTMSMATSNASGAVAVTSTTRGPPPVRSAMACAREVVSDEKACSAPSSAASNRRSGEGSMAITRAPRATAYWMAR